jgi:hypothetical protein
VWPGAGAPGRHALYLSTYTLWCKQCVCCCTFTSGVVSCGDLARLVHVLVSVVYDLIA